MVKSSDINDLLKKADDSLQAGHQVVLATVLKCWGSAPRKAGSMMIIDQEGHFEGSVSGGCVESAVIHEALSLLEEEDQSPRFLKYGVSNENAWQVGLPCGGQIEILLERLPAAIFHSLHARQAQAQSCWLLRHLPEKPGDPVTSWLLDETQKTVLQGDTALPFAIAPFATSISQDVGRLIVQEDQRYFLHVFEPPLHLYMIGAVHIAQHLCVLAGLAGFAVTVIDPRGLWATEDRFPDITVVEDWPDAVLSAEKLTERSAVICLSHDPKLDDPAFHKALAANTLYVGALSSRKNHQKRCERLKQQGLTQEQLARIHAPIGLDIGGLTPAEIAISIMAEIIALLRGKHEPFQRA